MDYEQFITEIKKYWDLRKKGLKKQANSLIPYGGGSIIFRRVVELQKKSLKIL